MFAHCTMLAKDAPVRPAPMGVVAVTAAIASLSSLIASDITLTINTAAAVDANTQHK